MAFLHTFTWRDLLDIGILALLAYPVYASLRGTTAVRILAGVVFLGLLSVAAETLGLVLTTWLLRGVGAVAILLLIVVFHEELRGALLGASPLRWLRGRRETAAAREEIEAMARCFLDLAERHVGGIFVFPGRDPIEAHLTSGTVLDGRFSPEVVSGLLHHGSPVHDGAMVIEGGRISKAGCFLPLSTRPDLDHRFGTRHRSAAGLSERTDAVVVVVSEERGEVSVAEGGDVTRARGFEDLHKRIREAVPVTGGRRPVRIPLVRDLAGKILVLSLVVAFWALVTDRGEKLIMVVGAPVTFLGAPDRYELVHAAPEKVQLKVRGSRRLLRSLGAKGATITVDLSGAGRGRTRLPIDARAVGLAPGIEVIDVSPPFATVDLEELLVKQVPVKVDLAGAPALGVAEIRSTVVPPKVWLVGAGSAVQGVQSVLTQTIQRDEVDGSTTRDARLVMPGGGVRLREREPSIVEVHLDVEWEKGESSRRPESGAGGAGGGDGHPAGKAGE